MPDVTFDRSLANLRLTGGLLCTATVVTLIGSLVSYATGEEKRSGRTHMDAVLVLLFVGVALAVATVIVFLEHRERRS